MLDTDGCRYCDRCGVKLTPENNKNGFELCDRCDKQLHEELKADREKREKERRECYLHNLGLNLDCMSYYSCCRACVRAYRVQNHFYL